MLANTFYGVYLSQTGEVMRLYKYMKELGLKPDHRMHHLLISAHVINRVIEAAMDALTTMVLVYLSLIRCCVSTSCPFGKSPVCID
jgi:hypothetical protein